MFQTFFELLRGDVAAALENQEALKEAHRRYLFRNDLAFAEAMKNVPPQSLALGVQSRTQAEIRVQNIFGHHLIQGRSGSGKSRYAESVILQLLRTLPEVGVVLVDGKGELFERMLAWVESFYAMADGGREFLDRIIVLNPFDSSSIPPLNFLIPPSGYPAELLADDVLSGLRRLFSEDRVSVRMEVLLRNALLVLIEAGMEGPRLSLLEAADLLTNESFRERALLRVKNEEAKGYFYRDFLHESHGTVEAVKARLSYLLLSEQVRLALGANDCIQFREAIGQGNVVLVNLGKTLLATDRAREVVATLLFSTFLRAVFSRPMNSGPHILTFLDEFQNFLLPEVFERLFTEARAYRCFLTAICQQLAAQVNSRQLREIILNNARYVSLFSSNEEDASFLGSVMFRPSGCLPKPRRLFSESRRRSFYTETEEIQILVRRIPALKSRTFYFWDKESPYGAQLLQTLKVSEPRETAALGGSWLPKTIGNTKENARRVIEDRHKSWGLGVRSATAAAPTRQKRSSILASLEAHLKAGKENKRG